MRVNKDLKRRTLSQDVLALDSKKRTGESPRIGKDFKSYMLSSEASIVKEELERLKEKIEEKGSQLMEHLTWENFLGYRDAVKEFMEIYVKKNHVLKEVTGIGFRDKRKIYTLIDKVDQELDKIKDAVLEGEGGKIKAISSITEIRGLLMDVFR